MLVFVWIFLFEPHGNGIHRGTRLLQSYACAKPAEGKETRVVPAILEMKIRIAQKRSYRSPKINGGRKGKTRRHHSDDGAGNAVQRDGLIQNVGSRGETIFPKGVAQNDKSRGTRLIVICVEDTA